MTPDSFTIILLIIANIGILLLAIGIHRRTKVLQAEMEILSLNIRL